MSTILDALKKVEQERTSDSAAAQQRQLEALQPTTELRQKRFIKGIVGGSLVLALLILAAITYYMFSGDPQPSASQANRAKAAATPKKTPQTALAGNQKASADRSSRPTPTRPIRKRQSRTQDNPSVDKATPPPRTAFNAPNQPPTTNRANNTAVNNKPPTQRPKLRTNRAPEASTNKPAPQQRQEPNTTAPPQVQPQRKPEPNTGSHSHIERLTDGSLDVQAIAWSPNREESMAVINSKIVREGGSVDDYALVAIGQDDVVVRKGGREWRVVIGRN